MKLYKRNKNGSIQEWTIVKAEGRYIVYYGKLDGKVQKITTAITGGKQNRTIAQQVELEINSQIKEKKDEGYKSLEDLEISSQACSDDEFAEDIYFFTKGVVNYSTTSLQHALESKLPIYNTDANGNVKPMLAHPITKVVNKKEVSQWHRVTYPIAGEPKLDGVRCLMFKGENGELLFDIPINSISREGKSYDFGTTKIREKLIEMFLDNPDVILDGELYVHGMEQNQISGAMRTGKYVPEIHDKMEYHVYDIVDPNKTYEQRKSELYYLYNIYKCFTLVEQTLLYSREEIDIYEERQIDAGYEGIMLKPLDGKYEIGKRSYNNLKVKRFLEEDFEIIGYELGKRGVQDLKFVCITKDGEEFKPVATGTVEEKQKLYDMFVSDSMITIGKPLLIGKKAVVKFKFWSEYGVPNHGHVKDVRDYE